MASPAGRWTKWVTVLAWVAIAVALGPLGSRLTSVQTNDTVSYLPRNAESTRVDAALQRFPDAKQVVALVVYRRDGGLHPRVHAVPGADALVGGAPAIDLDVTRATAHDRAIIIPLVLAVVLVILAILLRAVVAPLLLIATVILSLAAALGVSMVVYDKVFGFAGSDVSVPLYAFIFLVALGIDDNIFLMTRVREESARLGTRAGALRGLAVTGGVITSAGLVLAATFSVLAVLPLVTMTEIGFVVAFGVLLDTLVVRSLLVPALSFELDRRIWWRSALSRRPAPPLAERPRQEREAVPRARA